MLLKPKDGRRWGSRIVGGQRALLGSVPHQVSLQDGSFGHFCGGSIISADIIISAAHCCSHATPNAILAGLNNLDQPEEGAQKVEADQVVIHPNYSEPTIFSDICIIRLRKSLKIGNKSRTAIIPLPPSGYSASGKGNVQEGGPNSLALMVVQVPIITDYQWLVFISCSYLSITSAEAEQHVKVSFFCSRQIKNGSLDKLDMWHAA